MLARRALSLGLLPARGGRRLARRPQTIVDRVKRGDLWVSLARCRECQLGRMIRCARAGLGGLPPGRPAVPDGGNGRWSGQSRRSRRLSTRSTSTCWLMTAVVRSLQLIAYYDQWGRSSADWSWTTSRRRSVPKRRRVPRHAGRQRGGRGHRHARTPALLPALFAAGYRYEEMLSATWTNVNKHLVNARACVRALERAP